MKKKIRWSLLLGAIPFLTLVFTGHDPVFGLNAGFVALAVNMALAVGISLFSRRS